MTTARVQLASWWHGCPDTRRDVLYYLLLAAVAGTEAAVGLAGAAPAAGSPVPGAVAVVLGPSALLLRSRRPVAALLTASAVLVAMAWAGASTGVAVTALAFVVLSAVSREPGARPVPTFLLAAGAVAATTLLEAGALPARPVDFVFGTAGTAFTIAVGVHLKQYRAALAELAERNHELERLRVREAEVAVEAERHRIARDMHDVVAHHVSAIAVRAHAAAFVSRAQPEAPVAALTYIGVAASDTLAALHGMIGALRTADGAPAPLLPQPSLSDLGPLVATLQDAGHQVRLSTPPPTDVPADVALTAYRILQECLTNVLRHAPRADVTITVGHEPGALHLVVANPLLHARAGTDHRGSGSTAPAPGGHGLKGMRERAVIAGGSLVAGPDGRQWVVRALLPTSGARRTAPSLPAQSLRPAPAPA